MRLIATNKTSAVDAGGAGPPLVFHIITTLETGGAQNMLYKLLSGRDANRYRHAVAALAGEDPIAPRIRALGVPVHCLGLRRAGWNAPIAVGRLLAVLRSARPTIVQTWMHHADLLGGVCARMAGCRRILWGLRHSDLDPAVTKRRTILIARACGALSRRIPSLILACSQASQQTHQQLGYCEEKMVLAPNGFDTDAFRPDAAARDGVRRELGLRQDAILIGLFARYHGMKDHRSFCQAAGLLARDCEAAHFVLCGDGVDAGNADLKAFVAAAGISKRCSLLGRRPDMPRLTAALDIATSSSSSGEGFSNALGEAMASGVPCVTTRVGDSALIVGDTGAVTPPRNPEALYEAWRRLIAAGSEERIRLGRLARERILRHFSLPCVVEQYERLYDRLVENDQ